MKKGLKKGLKILATVMLLVTALAVTAGPYIWGERVFSVPAGL